MARESAPEVRRFVTSLRFPPDDPRFAEEIDLASLGMLSEIEREWAEFTLSVCLHYGDPRIPRALAHLCAARG